MPIALQVCQAHLEWGERFQEASSPLPVQALPAELPTPLRVGYLSADLYTHSVSYFAEAPLTHHRSTRRVPAAAAALFLAVLHLCELLSMHQQLLGCTWGPQVAVT